MKTSDIPADAFLAAIVEVCVRREATSAGRWDVASILAGHPERVGTGEACGDYSNMPAKLVLSKAKNLIRKHLLDGCACGCRGDFALPGTYRTCLACGRTNWHHIRRLETVTDGEDPGMFMHRECWHCHHTWKDRIDA